MSPLVQIRVRVLSIRRSPSSVLLVGKCLTIKIAETPVFHHQKPQLIFSTKEKWASGVLGYSAPLQSPSASQPSVNYGDSSEAGCWGGGDAWCADPPSAQSLVGFRRGKFDLGQMSRRF